MKEVNILLVDDEEMVLDSLQQLIELETDYIVHTSANPLNALELLEKNEIDVIITDYLMPEMNGIEFLIEAKKMISNSTLIMLTGYADKENAIRAINEVGIYQYIEKPWDNEDFLIHVKNAVERVDLLGEIQRKYIEVRKACEGTVYRLAKASEMFDEDTFHHILRISLVSEKLAELSGEDEEYCYNIKYASMMHDVGKIGIPKEILTKEDKLSREEFEVIKNHPEIGAAILNNPENQLLQMANEIAHYHHEKIDGKGYPTGISGEKIPKSARIVAIADVFDALLSERSYKASLSKKEVKECLTENKGTHFDSELVDLFLDHFDIFIKIYEEISSIKGEDISKVLF